MYSKLGFQRNFYIFSNEDTGFEAGQKPTGHVKIEVRDGKGRLHAVAHNLRDGGDRFEYSLYLLQSGMDSVEPVRVGRLLNRFSNLELTWSFDPHNVGQSGYPIDSFDVIAILAEYADRQGGSVLCPLAAYRNKRVQWRSIIMASTMKKRTQPDENASRNIIENLTENAAENSTENAVENAAKNATENATENATKAASVPATGTVDDEILTDNIPIDVNTVTKDEVSDIAEEPEDNEKSQQPENPQQPEKSQQPENPQQPEQYKQQTLTDINTGCVYLNGNMCGAFVQSGAVMPNPCSTCNVNRGEKPIQEQLPGDLSKLRAMLDSNFEEKDPFRSKRSDYIWWKVTNPVNLNNILYQNNIRSPLMFNPVVMLAHYKYRHLIIGIFTHINGRKYVVCGVPGMHLVDRKPFGELSTWVQTERSRPQYGAFGYWLVYINPDDGKIMNLSQQ